MSLVKYVQFTCPIVGMFLFVTSYASEHWITTDDSLYHWGLLTKCQPGNVSSTVECTYMSPRENEDYFIAAQCFATIALLLYCLLLFQFRLLKVKVARQQLAAVHAGILTALIAILILLVGANYSSDSRWKDREPSLGWSFWIAIPACVLALLSTVTLVLRGRREYKNSATERKKKITSKNQTLHRSASKVHPADAENGHAIAAAGGLPEQRGKHQQQHGQPNNTQNSSNQTTPEEDRSERGAESDDVASDQANLPKRQWKRRLSPISRGTHVGFSDKDTKEDLSQRSSVSEADDPHGQRACVHSVPDIIVTPNSPDEYNYESD